MISTMLIESPVNVRVLCHQTRIIVESLQEVKCLQACVVSLHYCEPLSLPSNRDEDFDGHII